jgi:hypothetical protein
MKPRLAKDVTTIACCTFCGRRNILKWPLATESNCAGCGKPLEVCSDIKCPHCKAKPIQVSAGRGLEAEPILICPACDSQIADGIPLSPEYPALSVWTVRMLRTIAARLVSGLSKASPWYQYQPKAARAQFQELWSSWKLESHTCQMERQGKIRPRESDLPDPSGSGGGEHIKRSRQSVLLRHTTLLDKYPQYISTVMTIANGKIYQDEYGDEIWERAEREIKKIIVCKIFNREYGIREQEKFHSVEFLSRCEPGFGSEFSERWIFDELRDRLKAYHQTRLHSAAAGATKFEKMSGVEFEQWLIASIRRAGIVDVKPTRTTGDQGADIIVRHGRSIVIQAKCYQQSVGNSAVQEVHAARSHYAADEAWVVTNSKFTQSARELALSTGVVLVDKSNFMDTGLMIARQVGLEDTQFRAEARVGEFGRPGELRTADESPSPARETELVPEPPLLTTVPDLATRAAGRPPISRVYEVPQNSLRIVTGGSRRMIAGLIGLALLVGTAGSLLMIHSRQEVEHHVWEVLEVWTSTALTNDLAGQVECYAPVVAPFFQRSRLTLQEVAAEKQKIMKNYPRLKKYAISNVNFEQVSSDMVAVSFDKSWEAHGNRVFAGSEKESLELRPLGGRWRITAEREIKIYWVRKK